MFRSFSLVLLSVGAFYVWKIWKCYKFFKNRGLKTPRSFFITGNFTEFVKKRNYSEVLFEWTKLYGKTYGYYEGHLPILVTSDLDLINEIFIKQYQNFSAKKKRPLDREDNAQKMALNLATGSRWKNMRVIMNPSFSGSKLRELSPIIAKCVDRLMSICDSETQNNVNLTSLFKRFTMDTIWNCAFGLDINLQNSSDNEEYLTRSERVFEKLRIITPEMYFITYFHEFRKYFVFIYLLVNYIKYKCARLFGSKSVDDLFWLRETSDKIIENRIKSNNNKRDLLQLLLEAQTNEIGDVQFESVEMKTHFKKKLTLDEIKMNLALIMIVGYETTSSALTQIGHILATMPEEQRKLIQEIDEVFPPGMTNNEPDFDEIQKLKYMDMFIKESLRFFPIANATLTRRCINPTTIHGIYMPKDLVIIIDCLSIHFDKELWGPEDPNIFYPLRFSTEKKRNPLAFLGFGLGPRNCLGLKFAMTELKITLTKILMNFEIEKCEKTVEKLRFKEGFGSVSYSVDDIYVRFKRRNQK